MPKIFDHPAASWGLAENGDLHFNFRRNAKIKDVVLAGMIARKNGLGCSAKSMLKLEQAVQNSCLPAGLQKRERSVRVGFDRGHNPDLKFRFDFLVQMNPHRVEPKFLQDPLKANLIIG